MNPSVVALVVVMAAAEPAPSSLPALHSVASARLGFTLDLPAGLAVERCGDSACHFARSEDAGAGLQVEVQVLDRAPSLDEQARALAREGWRERERRVDPSGHAMLVVDHADGRARVWYLHRSATRALLITCSDEAVRTPTLVAVCRSLRSLR
jgi:hypothetical protein